MVIFPEKSLFGLFISDNRQFFTSHFKTISLHMTSEPQRSLFIYNLPYKFKSDELRDKFSPYGSIERIDIPNYHGSLKAIAFVHYRDVDDAIAAMNGLNGESFQGHPMTIEYSTKEMPDKKSFKRSPKRHSRDSPRDFRKGRDGPHNPSHKIIQGPFQTMVDPYSNIPISIPQPMMMMNIPQVQMPMPVPIQMPMMQTGVPMIQQMPMAVPVPLMPMGKGKFQGSPKKGRMQKRRFDDEKPKRHRY
ncbi:hypothetical protein TRFO_40141 [Tritrichomonas foetus]|uniref:RRM domain-containing protein n=1 Tax=Tritrichomonas foetus TaxID=1144522 RepID=A0A1J4J288_9EUKA|nr:hypothetical protein TRFO_40141 [Tritrichomonas foetus]|eukprot:OHS93582.1 hypothetical protein TRFO_40141 [Tritrichomonas foetus]